MDNKLYNPTVMTVNASNRTHICADDVDFWCRECLPPMKGRSIKDFVDKMVNEVSDLAHITLDCMECGRPVSFYAEFEAVVYMNVDKVMCSRCA